MLSEVERRVYAEVRAAARRGERATIAAVAGRTGIPRSSVARVAVTLGYRGWVDMTSQLVRYHTSLERHDAVAESVDVVAAVLQRARRRTILLDAIGDSEICLDYLLFRLCELGYCAMPYSPGVVEATVGGSGRGEDASGTADDAGREAPGKAGCGEGMREVADGAGRVAAAREMTAGAAPSGCAQLRSVLLVINESGMSMVPACVKAAAAGMEIVAITASHDTPVSKLAQVNVVIKNNKSTPDAYEPNYFTAGVLVFMERVLAACSEAAEAGD